MKKFFLLCLSLGLSSFTSLFCQSGNVDQSQVFADRRMKEINKLVKLTTSQQLQLNQKCFEYQKALDSLLSFENNPLVYIEKYNLLEEDFNDFFFKVLTEEQAVEYVKVKGSADLKRKTNEKIQLLKESGEYTEEELQKMYNEIYKYLVLEKVVYTRDKFNINKQKENIYRLKNIQPTCLKEAESRRKLKYNGRLESGKVKWSKK